jgi:hypothetical protein
MGVGQLLIYPANPAETWYHSVGDTLHSSDQVSDRSDHNWRNAPRCIPKMSKNDLKSKVKTIYTLSEISH